MAEVNPHITDTRIVVDRVEDDVVYATVHYRLSPPVEYVSIDLAQVSEVSGIPVEELAASAKRVIAEMDADDA